MDPLNPNHHDKDNDDRVSGPLFAQLSNATRPSSNSGNQSQGEMHDPFSERRFAQNTNNFFGIEGEDRSLQYPNPNWLSTSSPAPNYSLQTKEPPASAPNSSQQTGHNSGPPPGNSAGASGRLFPHAPPPVSHLNNMLPTSGLAPGRPYEYGAPLPPGMMIGHPGQEMMRPLQTMSMYHGIMSPFEFVPPQRHMMHPGSHYHPMNGPYHGPQSNSQGSLPFPNPGYRGVQQGIPHRPMQPPPPSLRITVPPPRNPVPGQWNYPPGHSKPAPPKRAPRKPAPPYRGGPVKAKGEVSATPAPRKETIARPPASTPTVVGSDGRPVNVLLLNLPPISEETRAKQEAIKTAARQALMLPSKKEWIATIAGHIAANVIPPGRKSNDSIRSELSKRPGHENPNMAVASNAPAARSQHETGVKQDIRSRRTPYSHPDVQVTKEHIRKAIPKEASAIFHILDRRVNFDAHEEDATMYSLLRSWVQDDPFRYTPPAGSNLLEYISLSSQRRVEYVDEQDEDDYDKMENEEIRNQEANSIERGTVDVFAKLRSIQQTPSMDTLRASQVIQGGKRRNQQRAGLKKRRRQVLKSLKRLGIDLDVIGARIEG
jgi:hypothetical protein